MRRLFSRLAGRVFFWLMILGSLFITLASLVYFDPDTLAPFVIEKLPLRFEWLWLTSLKVHVASALVSLPLCLLLTTRWLQKRAPWHRWLGRLAGLIVVALLVPTGVVLSFEAKGGAPVTLGFILSALIVLFAMGYGVHFARQRRPAAHARAMRHVVAQMSVAITSRAMLIALGMTRMHPETAYVVALWVPVLFSAVLAEGISGRLNFSNFSFSNPLPRGLP